MGATISSKGVVGLGRLFTNHQELQWMLHLHRQAQLYRTGKVVVNVSAGVFIPFGHDLVKRKRLKEGCLLLHYHSTGFSLHHRLLFPKQLKQKAKCILM